MASFRGVSCSVILRVKDVTTAMWYRELDVSRWGSCQSLVSAVLLLRLCLRHDAFRLPSWSPPRRSLCDGLKVLVRTRESPAQVCSLCMRASSRRVEERLG